MKSMTPIVGLCAALLLAGCNNADQNTPDYDYQDTAAGDNAPAAAPDVTGASAQRPDTQFLTTAMTSGTKEIQLGQLAQQKATNDDVKDYAKMLVDDHQKANDELLDVVDKAGIAVSPNTSAVEQARQQLSGLSGAAFDKAFVDMMVRDHQDAINLVSQKVNGTGNGDVQKWATDTLPTLREHLQRAQELQQSLQQGR